MGVGDRWQPHRQAWVRFRVRGESTSSLFLSGTLSLGIDHAINRICGGSGVHINNSLSPSVGVPDLRLGGTSRIQQDHAYLVRHRPPEGMGCQLRHRRTFLGGIPLRVQVGGRPLCTMADGILVRTTLLSS